MAERLLKLRCRIMFLLIFRTMSEQHRAARAAVAARRE